MFVGRGFRHRQRNAVGGVDQSGGGAALGRDLGQRSGNPIGQRLDEARMIVKQPQLVDLRRFRADLLPCPLDIFQILPAAGMRAEGGSDKRQGMTHAVLSHLADRIDQAAGASCGCPSRPAVAARGR